MTKIGDAARLAALMQLQISSRLTSATEARTAQVPPRKNAPTDAEEGAGFSREVQLAVRALEGSGDALHRSAFRVFLRHRLTRELGARPSADASFDALLDEVLLLMESDEDLKNATLVAGQHLVALSRRPAG